VYKIKLTIDTFDYGSVLPIYWAKKCIYMFLI